MSPEHYGVWRLFWYFYYIPLFFQFTRGDSALVASVRLLPFVSAFIPAVFLAGGLLQFFGRCAVFYPPLAILMLVGGIPLLFITPTTEIWKLCIYQALTGAGSGLSFQNAFSVATALSKSNKNAAISSSMLVKLARLPSGRIKLYLPELGLPLHEGSHGSVSSSCFCSAWPTCRFIFGSSYFVGR